MTGKTSIQLEYGRKLECTAAEASEWLDDLLEGVDEVMSQPLRIGDDQSAGLSRFAFCAPEVIRGAIFHQLLRDKIAARGDLWAPRTPAPPAPEETEWEAGYNQGMRGPDL